MWDQTGFGYVGFDNRPIRLPGKPVHAAIRHAQCELGPLYNIGLITPGNELYRY